jgi:DnaJ-class molecular chaperone
MNAERAKKILNLGETFTPEELKKSYRRLVMLYHPDKCTLPDANEKFNEIQSAYSYLQNGGEENINVDEILKNIFKSFSSNIINGIPINKIFNNSRSNSTKPNKLYITPKEYFTGTTKSILLDLGNCNCESLLCNSCAGSGYSMDFNVCTNCMGDGWIKSCNNSNCSNKVEVHIPIPSLINLDGKIIVDCSNGSPIGSNSPYSGTPRVLSTKEYKVELNDSQYFYENGNLYCNFDITLKESLIGFNKIFKDPFDNIHNIFIKNNIIKQNDGYSLDLKYQNHSHKMVLLFNILYPPKISKELREIIKKHF